MTSGGNQSCPGPDSHRTPIVLRQGGVLISEADINPSVDQGWRGEWAPRGL